MNDVVRTESAALGGGRIKEEIAIKNLLSRMPDDVADSFSDLQLMHLKLAVGAREWGRHKVDFRGTLALPLAHSRIYYVFLMGRNHRELSRKEKMVSNYMLAMIIALFIMFSVLLGILILYLAKSAAGIDLIPGFSFGVWNWFKELWQ